MSPNNRARLRELGYSVDADGKIICHRKHETRSAVLTTRYLHERTAIIRFSLDQDSKAGRELVEHLILVVDEPRALVGRTRNGSAVMLFRVTEDTSVTPYQISGGQYNQSVFELVANGVRLSFEITSDAVLDPAAYIWQKGKSPLDVRRDDLGTLFADACQTVIDAAFKAGAQWAELYDADQARAREFETRIKPEHEARVAAGYYSPEAIQAREDEALVANAPPHTNWLSDGPIGAAIVEARKRIAMRKQKQAAQG
jgi:hypothetical protein